MNRNDHIEAIRAACIKANPDKDCPVENDGNHCAAHAIRLADVLLAIDAEHRFTNLGARYTEGVVTDADESALLDLLCNRWNLHQDDLTEQSDECLAFLAEDLLS